MDSKHLCKFCKKSFPCGRSLGGHIRSHLYHNNSKNTNDHHHHHAPTEETKNGYELRENPKKTNKAADFLNHSPSSWSTESKRSSFGGGNHSLSSASEVVEPELEEFDIAMCLIMLSKDVGNLRNVSFHDTNKYSHDISLVQAKNTSRNRKGEKIKGKYSAFADACDDIASKKGKNIEFSASEYLQIGAKINEKEVLASNDQGHKNYAYCLGDSSGKNRESLELTPSGHLSNVTKMKEVEVRKNGFASNDQNKKSPEKKRKVGETSNVKKKLDFVSSGHVDIRSKLELLAASEYGSTSNDQSSYFHDLGFGEVRITSELLSNNDIHENGKRSKFECTTCNKVFHSYQALGGHRASHKKIMGSKCSPSPKLEPNYDEILAQPNDQLLVEEHVLIAHDFGIGSSSKSSAYQSKQKVVQKHECPICLRVFPSGQALGGHKRSHIIAANNANNTANDLKYSNVIMDNSSSPETRDFLDLNLPPAAAADEVSNTVATSSSTSNLAGLIKPYWWIESSHKHEPVLSLISN